MEEALGRRLKARGWIEFMHSLLAEIDEPGTTASLGQEPLRTCTVVPEQGSNPNPGLQAPGTRYIRGCPDQTIKRGGAPRIGAE